MAGIELWDYQNTLVNLIRKEIAKKNLHILSQLPTGGGKTVIFSYMAISASLKGNNTLILTDREELLTQAGGTIKKFDVNCAYIKAGAKYYDQRKNIFIGMSQTLRNRITDPYWINFITNEIDIIIIDEAHIQEFNYLFESGLLKEKLVLGFTATPIRTGNQRQLGLDYDVLIRGAEPKDLIKLGKLLNCDLYEADSPDMTGVKINQSSGDYNEGSMFERFDKPTTYQGLIRNYKQIAEGKRMLVYCCNVEHAIKTTVQLVEAGYRAKFVCSEPSQPKEKETMTSAEKAVHDEKLRRYNFFVKNYMEHSGPRKDLVAKFKAKEFDILVNVDMLTKGFDESSVEVVAVLRATLSLALWLQMLGRGSRIDDSIGKTHFIALDFGGNKKRLGGYDDNRNWSLWHETRKGGGVAPVKECGHTSTGRSIRPSNEIKIGCRRLILASYQICPFCGFKYPEKSEEKEVDLSLSKLVTEQGIVINTKSPSKMDWEELTQYRAAKGHKQPWLWRQLWTRGKDIELSNYAAKYHWSKPVLEKAINYCKNNL
jgi:superfamily II DNA or RNA helicase